MTGECFWLRIYFADKMLGGNGSRRCRLVRSQSAASACFSESADSDCTRFELRLSRHRRSRQRGPTSGTFPFVTQLAYATGDPVGLPVHIHQALVVEDAWNILFASNAVTHTDMVPLAVHFCPL